MAQGGGGVRGWEREYGSQALQLLASGSACEGAGGLFGGNGVEDFQTEAGGDKDVVLVGSDALSASVGSG